MKLKLFSLVYLLVAFSLISYLVISVYRFNKVQDSSINKKGVQVLPENTSVTPTIPFCTEPSGGCASGYYWSTSSCSCSATQITTTCSPPTTGCGIDYYWDTASCMCKPVSGTCTPPTSGCPVNYYWNTSSCSCQISSTTCISPTGGCGTNYYWDSSVCICKPITTTCTQPSSGCPDNTYWNSSTCSCKSSITTCISPTYGCGSNYYWDSSACSCKAATSCPTIKGCQTGYYWDSYSCLCKQYTATPGCIPPSSGCTTNFYWDSNSCLCKEINTYYQQQNFDRLAYESFERINCIKSFLNTYEFERFRYLLPQTASEEEEIKNLSSKVASCWNISTVQTTLGTVTPQINKSPFESEACLINGLGEDKYREIYLGIKQPTYEEHLIYEKCYGKSNSNPLIYYTADEKFSQEIISCLQTVLGNNLYLKVREGQSEVPYQQREMVNRCFGVNPQPFEEGRVYQIPEKIKDCLSQSLGETRFNEINSGKNLPTDEEKEKGNVCFSKLNKDQVKFLPPPTSQVPFLESDPEIIKLTQASQETNKVNDQTIGGKILFLGKAPANSVVNIYIYSEPIVVTTKTDENGDWVYELDQPLNGEKHIAYAVFQNTSGKAIRSSVFDFTVIAAEKDLTKTYLEEKTISKSFETKLIRLGITAIIISFLIVLVISTLYYLKQAGKGVVKNDNENADKSNLPENDGKI